MNYFKEKNNTLEATFKFKNFIEAFAFMTEVAMISEKANHHPDWSNSYNMVIINLSTHSEEKITEKDYKLAEEIESLLR
jgi:4a-hydroxytetrahydrobiopterin dehydratase